MKIENSADFDCILLHLFPNVQNSMMFLSALIIEYEQNIICILTHLLANHCSKGVKNVVDRLNSSKTYPGKHSIPLKVLVT